MGDLLVMDPGSIPPSRPRRVVKTTGDVRHHSDPARRIRSGHRGEREARRSQMRHSLRPVTYRCWRLVTATLRKATRESARRLSRHGHPASQRDQSRPALLRGRSRWRPSAGGYGARRPVTAWTGCSSMPRVLRHPGSANVCPCRGSHSSHGNCHLCLQRVTVDYSSDGRFSVWGASAGQAF